MSETVSSRSLLEGARALYSLVGAEGVLEYLLREARGLTGAELAAASHVPFGEAWQRGLHLRMHGAVEPAPPAAVSAAFAIHRRLSVAREPLLLRTSAETEPIFRGLFGDALESALLWAFPLLNRRGRLMAQVVIAKRSDAAFADVELRALLDLASLAALAMENAERLAFARRDQDRLLLLAEATDDALWDWNLDSNAFWWGGGIQHVIKSGAEVIGTTPSWKHERIHPGDAHATMTSLRTAIDSPASSWRMEYRFRRGDGSWAWVEDRAYFQRDASGRAYRIVGALRDISDQKWLEQQQSFLVQASAALASSLEVEKNAALVAALAAKSVCDWCVIVLFATEPGRASGCAVAHRDADRAQRVQVLVEKLADHLAGRAEALMGSYAVPAFGAREREALLEWAPSASPILDEIQPSSALHVPLVTGDKVLGLVTLVTSADATRHYSSSDLSFAEEFARRCGVALDKARLYEQAQNAIRARDAFMAILGHELRNPLSPITTALHLMQLRDPRSSREQEVIARQVKHLTRLVDDLLDISRVERGKVELSRKPVQLAEVVAKAVEIASPLLEQRRHTLELNVPASGLPLLADETRLAQVVANLLTNAARYTDEGGHIAVTGARDGANVVLRVRDNGIGMSADLLPRVFDLFVQAPRTSDRRQGGLGLGLSLVRSFVTLHGGTVEAHSDGPGRGSEFVVRLPAMIMELVSNGKSESSTTSRTRATGLRILIVDDNEDAGELLRELLLARGHDVLIAPDGPSALRAAPPFAPEVAILDIGLPVMDGYELARRLDTVVVPRPFMIALTGYGQEQDRARARDVGFDEHMVKPLDTQKLLELLERGAARRASSLQG